MRREPFADEVLERLLLDRLPDDDIRAWNRQPVPCSADDRALDDIRMADEAVLDLGRSNPDAADLDQVIDAPAVPEESVVVALEQVARVDGVAVEGRLRLLIVAPVLERSRVAGDEQLAGLGNLGLVARNELASRPGSSVVGMLVIVEAGPESSTTWNLMILLVSAKSMLFLLLRLRRSTVCPTLR